MPHYLYSPVGGTANMCPYPYERYCVGLDAWNAYCDYVNGTPHTNIQLDSPMDIITNWEAPVYLYTSTGVQSVAVVHYSNACACGCGPTYAVQCHLYSQQNGVGYIGSTYMAHITELHAQGTYNLSNHCDSFGCYNYLPNKLGKCAPAGGGGCSTVYHPHVEQAQASTGSSIQCPDTAIAATTWLYRWG